MIGAVVLLSGGMDSATLLRWVCRRHPPESVHALSFGYGQKHFRELEGARRIAQACGVGRHAVLDLQGVWGWSGKGSALVDPAQPIPRLEDLDASQRRQPPTYVPHRNLVFLAIAAAYAEAHGLREVYYGAQRQDRYGYWDCTPEFVAALNGVLGLNRGGAVVIHAPFAGLSKAEVLRTGLELGVDFALTWSCYRGEERPCGVCPSCVERAAAFAAVGQTDPLTERPA